MTVTYMLELTKEELEQLWLTLDLGPLQFGELTPIIGEAIREKVQRLMEGR